MEETPWDVGPDGPQVCRKSPVREDGTECDVSDYRELCVDPGVCMFQEVTSNTTKR